MEPPQLAAVGAPDRPEPQRAAPIGATSAGVFAKHPDLFEVVARVVFGGTVIVAAVGQLLPGGPEYLATRIPTHPGPWFAFWSNAARADPTLFAGVVAGLELIVGFSVLLGCLRKPLYSIGIVLGLFIWTTIEGVSGVTSRHSLGSSAGLLYVVGLLLLITVETTYGPDPLTVDAFLSRRFERWRRWSNFIGRRDPLPPPTYMLAFAPPSSGGADAAGDRDASAGRSARRPRR